MVLSRQEVRDNLLVQQRCRNHRECDVGVRLRGSQHIQELQPQIIPFPQSHAFAGRQGGSRRHQHAPVEKEKKPQEDKKTQSQVFQESVEHQHKCKQLIHFADLLHFGCTHAYQQEQMLAASTYTWEPDRTYAMSQEVQRSFVVSALQKHASSHLFFREKSGCLLRTKRQVLHAQRSASHVSIQLLQHRLQGFLSQQQERLQQYRQKHHQRLHCGVCVGHLLHHQLVGSAQLQRQVFFKPKIKPQMYFLHILKWQLRLLSLYQYKQQHLIQGHSHRRRVSYMQRPHYVALPHAFTQQLLHSCSLSSEQQLLLLHKHHQCKRKQQLELCGGAQRWSQQQLYQTGQQLHQQKMHLHQQYNHTQKKRLLLEEEHIQTTRQLMHQQEEHIQEATQVLQPLEEHRQEATRQQQEKFLQKQPQPFKQREKHIEKARQRLQQREKCIRKTRQQLQLRQQQESHILQRTGYQLQQRRWRCNVAALPPWKRWPAKRYPSRNAVVDATASENICETNIWGQVSDSQHDSAFAATATGAAAAAAATRAAAAADSVRGLVFLANASLVRSIQELKEKRVLRLIVPSSYSSDISTHALQPSAHFPSSSPPDTAALGAADAASLAAAPGAGTASAAAAPSTCHVAACRWGPSPQTLYDTDVALGSSRSSSSSSNRKALVSDGSRSSSAEDIFLSDSSRGNSSRRILVSHRSRRGSDRVISVSDSSRYSSYKHVIASGSSKSSSNRQVSFFTVVQPLFTVEGTLASTSQIENNHRNRVASPSTVAGEKKTSLRLPNFISLVQAAAPPKPPAQAEKPCVSPTFERNNISRFDATSTIMSSVAAFDTDTTRDATPITASLVTHTSTDSNSTFTNIAEEGPTAGYVSTNSTLECVYPGETARARTAVRASTSTTAATTITERGPLAVSSTAEALIMVDHLVKYVAEVIPFLPEFSAAHASAAFPPRAAAEETDLAAAVMQHLLNQISSLSSFCSSGQSLSLLLSFAAAAPSHVFDKQQLPQHLQQDRIQRQQHMLKNILLSRVARDTFRRLLLIAITPPRATYQQGTHQQLPTVLQQQQQQQHHLQRELHRQQQHVQTGLQQQHQQHQVCCMSLPTELSSSHAVMPLLEAYWKLNLQQPAAATIVLEAVAKEEVYLSEQQLIRLCTCIAFYELPGLAASAATAASSTVAATVSLHRKATNGGLHVNNSNSNRNSSKDKNRQKSKRVYISNANEGRSSHSKGSNNNRNHMLEQSNNSKSSSSRSSSSSSSRRSNSSTTNDSSGRSISSNSKAMVRKRYFKELGRFGEAALNIYILVGKRLLERPAFFDDDDVGNFCRALTHLRQKHKKLLEMQQRSQRQQQQQQAQPRLHQQSGIYTATAAALESYAFSVTASGDATSSAAKRVVPPAPTAATEVATTTPAAAQGVAAAQGLATARIAATEMVAVSKAALVVPATQAANGSATAPAAGAEAAAPAAAAIGVTTTPAATSMTGPPAVREEEKSSRIHSSIYVSSSPSTPQQNMYPSASDSYNENGDVEAHVLVPLHARSETSSLVSQQTSLPQLSKVETERKDEPWQDMLPSQQHTKTLKYQQQKQLEEYEHQQQGLPSIQWEWEPQLQVLQKELIYYHVKPLSHYFKIWSCIIGEALLASLPPVLHEYRYYNLIDVGEMLAEYMHEEKEQEQEEEKRRKEKTENEEEEEGRFYVACDNWNGTSTRKSSICGQCSSTYCLQQPKRKKQQQQKQKTQQQQHLHRVEKESQRSCGRDIDDICWNRQQNDASTSSNTCMHMQTLERCNNSTNMQAAACTKELAQRIASEVWKYSVLMKFGYSGKALTVLHKLDVGDDRTQRSLVRHVTKLFGFRWAPSFVAEILVAAAAVTYRAGGLSAAGKRSRHQVHSRKLYNQFALYLLQPRSILLQQQKHQYQDYDASNGDTISPIEEYTREKHLIQEAEEEEDVEEGYEEESEEHSEAVTRGRKMMMTTEKKNEERYGWRRVEGYVTNSSSTETPGQTLCIKTQGRSDDATTPTINAAATAAGTTISAGTIATATTAGTVTPTESSARIAAILSSRRKPMQHRESMIDAIGSPLLCCDVAAAFARLKLPQPALLRAIIRRAAREKTWMHLQHLLSLMRETQEVSIHSEELWGLILDDERQQRELPECSPAAVALLPLLMGRAAPTRPLHLPTLLRVHCVLIVSRADPPAWLAAGGEASTGRSYYSDKDKQWHKTLEGAARYIYRGLDGVSLNRSVVLSPPSSSSFQSNNAASAASVRDDTLDSKMSIAAVKLPAEAQQQNNGESIEEGANAEKGLGLSSEVLHADSKFEGNEQAAAAAASRNAQRHTANAAAPVNNLSAGGVTTAAPDHTKIVHDESGVADYITRKEEPVIKIYNACSWHVDAQDQEICAQAPAADRIAATATGTTATTAAAEEGEVAAPKRATEAAAAERTTPAAAAAAVGAPAAAGAAAASEEEEEKEEEEREAGAAEAGARTAPAPLLRKTSGQAVEEEAAAVAGTRAARKAVDGAPETATAPTAGPRVTTADRTTLTAGIALNSAGAVSLAGSVRKGAITETALVEGMWQCLSVEDLTFLLRGMELLRCYSRPLAVRAVYLLQQRIDDVHPGHLPALLCGLASAASDISTDKEEFEHAEFIDHVRCVAERMLEQEEIQQQLVLPKRKALADYSFFIPLYFGVRQQNIPLLGDEELPACIWGAYALGLRPTSPEAAAVHVEKSLDTNFLDEVDTNNNTNESSSCEGLLTKEGKQRKSQRTGSDVFLKLLRRFLGSSAAVPGRSLHLLQVVGTCLRLDALQQPYVEQPEEAARFAQLVEKSPFLMEDVSSLPAQGSSSFSVSSSFFPSSSMSSECTSCYFPSTFFTYPVAIADGLYSRMSLAAAATPTTIAAAEHKYEGEPSPQVRWKRQISTRSTRYDTDAAINAHAGLGEGRQANNFNVTQDAAAAAAAETATQSLSYSEQAARRRAAAAKTLVSETLQEEGIACVANFACFPFMVDLAFSRPQQQIFISSQFLPHSATGGGPCSARWSPTANTSSHVRKMQPQQLQPLLFSGSDEVSSNPLANTWGYVGSQFVKELDQQPRGEAMVEGKTEEGKMEKDKTEAVGEDQQMSRKCQKHYWELWQQQQQRVEKQQVSFKDKEAQYAAEFKGKEDTHAAEQRAEKDEMEAMYDVSKVRTPKEEIGYGDELDYVCSVARGLPPPVAELTRSWRVPDTGFDCEAHAGSYSSKNTLAAYKNHTQATYRFATQSDNKSSSITVGEKLIGEDRSGGNVSTDEDSSCAAARWRRHNTVALCGWNSSDNNAAGIPRGRSDALHQPQEGSWRTAQYFNDEGEGIRPLGREERSSNDPQRRSIVTRVCTEHSVPVAVFIGSASNQFLIDLQHAAESQRSQEYTQKISSGKISPNAEDSANHSTKEHTLLHSNSSEAREQQQSSHHAMTRLQYIREQQINKNWTQQLSLREEELYNTKYSELSGQHVAINNSPGAQESDECAELAHTSSRELLRALLLPASDTVRSKSSKSNSSENSLWEYGKRKGLKEKSTGQLRVLRREDLPHFGWRLPPYANVRERILRSFGWEVLYVLPLHNGVVDTHC